MPVQPAPAAAPANPTALPAPSSPAPADSTPSTPPAAPGIQLTLPDVVRMAIGNNTGLIAARQRLQKAQELIAQVNAQSRPQVRLDANDTYSSFITTFPSLPSLSIQNPFLPGGGYIPTVIDVGGSFPSGFIGFGGSGNAPGIALTPGQASPAPDDTAPSTTNAPASPSTTPSAAPGAPAPVKSSSRKSKVPTDTAAIAAVAPIVAGFLADEHDADEHDEAAVQPADLTAASPSEVGNAVTSASSSATATHLNNYAARLSVIQFIDVFGVVPTARTIQKDVVDFYSLDVDRVQNETALAAKNLYFNALLAQAQVDTDQQQVNYATENVRIAQSRFKHGFVSRLDVLTAQTALAASQQQLIAAQNQNNLAMADLGYLLGINVSTGYTLVPPALPPLDSTIDVPGSTTIALDNRPEMLEAGRDIDEAGHLVKLAQDGQKPALGLVATGQDVSSRTSTQPYSYGTVGAMLYFPLDDGGLTRSRVRSAKVDLQSQDLAIEQLKLTIGLEVQHAGLNIQNAQAQVAAAQTALDRANEAVRIARERYTAGLGTFLDVLNALGQLAVTRTNLSVADYLYQSALSQLVRAMGGH